MTCQLMQNLSYVLFEIQCGGHDAGKAVSWLLMLEPCQEFQGMDALF